MHKLVFVALVSIVLAGTVVLAPASSHAEDNGKGQVAAAASFAALDRNGDDRISRSEAGFDRVLSYTFAEIDTDGDGFVTPAEFAAADKNRTTVTKVTSE